MDLFKPKIHKNTKNKSFLDMHYLLKEKGVKNNLFFLVIYNERLMNIDPFSDNLTPQDKLEIEIEVRMNPWYFFREISRIEEPGGSTHFLLHLGNLALIFLCLQNFNVIEILPRQQGKTQSTLAIFIYIYYFLTTNSKFIFGNKTEGDAIENLTRFGTQGEIIPQWLIRKDKKDINNQKAVRSVHSRNSIKIVGTATDPKAADKLGRGLTAPCLWLDEVAFINYIKEIYGTATFAQGKASDMAKKNNKPSFKILTTTPNNIDVPEGECVWSMIQNSCVFDILMFDKNTQELMDLLKYNSRNDFFFLQFSYRELGLDEEWYSDQCRRVEHDKARIKREILLEWLNSTDKSIFNEENIDILMQYTLPIISSFELLGKYLIKFIKSFDSNKPYILGIDVAFGLNLDATAIVIVDPNSLEPIGYFHNNKIETPDLLLLIEELINNYFPNSCIAIEDSTATKSLLQDMRRNNTLKNKIIYYYTDDNTRETEKSLRNTSIEDNASIHKKYGIPITRVTRPIMLDILQHEVFENPSCFRIKDLIKEIGVLERDRTGKIGAASGMHDDLIFAYLYARYALSNIPHINRFIKYTNNTTIRSMEKIRNISNNYKAYNHFENTIGKEVNPDKKQSFLQKIIALNNYK